MSLGPEKESSGPERVQSQREPKARESPDLGRAQSQKEISNRDIQEPERAQSKGESRPRENPKQIKRECRTRESLE